MSFNSNALTLRVFRQCFRTAFCNDSNCEKYPCLLNHLNDTTKGAVRIKDFFTSCPYFYNVHDKPIVDLEKIGKITFTRGGK